MTDPGEPILLFDGVCGLCDRFVQFILRHDSTGKIRFAALQSETGQDLLRRFALPEKDLSFVVLIEGDKSYVRSSAALRSMQYLDGRWKYLSFLRVIPMALSDAAYDFVARRRYSWFGKYDQCIVPSAETKKRFL